MLEPLAGLHAMEGRFDEARALLATSDATFEELGLSLNSAVSHHAAVVEMLAGDPAAAERCLRKGFDALEEMGDRAVLSTTAAFLGETLVAQERDDEAERFAGLSAELAGRGRRHHAGYLARRPGDGARPAGRACGGRADGAAGRVARRADRLPESGGETLVVLGRVLRSRSAKMRRRGLLAEALSLYEQKGNRGRAPPRSGPTLLRQRQSETIAQ